MEAGIVLYSVHSNYYSLHQQTGIAIVRTE